MSFSFQRFRARRHHRRTVRDEDVSGGNANVFNEVDDVLRWSAILTILALTRRRQEQSQEQEQGQEQEQEQGQVQYSYQ